MTTAPLACSICGKKDAPSYFKVERVAPDGTTAPVTITCSVKCLISWAYQFAQMQGMKLAFGARQAIDQIRNFFKR